MAGRKKRNLGKEKYCISTAHHSLSTGHSFAANFNIDGLEYFKGENDGYSMKISGTRSCSVNILDWGRDTMSWKESGKSRKVEVRHELRNLEPGGTYILDINGKTGKELVAGPDGYAVFDGCLRKNLTTIRVVRK